MTALTLDWPQSASALLTQAQGGEGMVDLIMAGTTNLASWLIEHRILPVLRERQIKTLNFTVNDTENRTACLVPLPDGSAFACNPSGIWSTMESHDALSEIQYIGLRFAPSDHWKNGFEARLQQDDGTYISVGPMEVAKFWEGATGAQPLGFKAGLLDQMEAFGLNAIDKVFHMQGRLGL